MFSSNMFTLSFLLCSLLSSFAAANFNIPAGADVSTTTFINHIPSTVVGFTTMTGTPPVETPTPTFTSVESTIESTTTSESSTIAPTSSVFTTSIITSATLNTTSTTASLLPTNSANATTTGALHPSGKPSVSPSAPLTGGASRDSAAGLVVLAAALAAVVGFYS